MIQKKHFAELLGTFFLVFVGCGAIMFSGSTFGILGISLTFGLTLAALIYALGPISGCHINPAVTIAMWLDRQISTKDGFLYIVMQVVGAVFGSAALFTITRAIPAIDVGLGQTTFSDISVGAAFLIELLLTWFFVTVIFAVTSKKAHPAVAGIAIGLALVVVHFMGITLTGASVNPARSLAPALFVWSALSQVWLYIVAPLLGGMLATLTWRMLR